MNKLNKLLDDIKNSSNIAIVGHTSPDGDAIGACTAMGKTLNKQNKDYTIFIEEPDKKYDFLLEQTNTSFKNDLENDFDLFIALDCATLERIGEFTPVFNNANITWNIDHHISNTKYADHNYIDSKASSASEIVFDIITILNIDIDKSIAKSIYTGIAYDTGGFKHSNTTSKTLNIVAILIEKDFDFSKIIQNIFNEKELLTLKLQGKVINNIETFFDNKLVVSTLSLDDIKLYTNNTDVSSGGAVNILKSVKNSKVVVLLSEKEPGITRISLRSEYPYDVCSIASEFGGGGHIKAAGASIDGPLEEAKEQILQATKKLFI